MTTKTTFMETLSKWAETNSAIMSSMTKTSQQCWEKGFSAGQMWTDGMTVAGKRSQQAWAEWMEKSTAAMGTMSSCKDATKALECAMDFAVGTCCDAIETGSEISQTLTKSATEAQQTMTKTMLSGLEAMKKDGAKVVKSTETAPWGTATSMTAWWSNPAEQASSWMKASWWTPTTGMTKTSAGETAASTGAVIAAKSATASKGTSTSK